MFQNGGTCSLSCRTPPNVKFEVDDVESPWAHDQTFGYVFCRYMAACILDWPKLVGNIYELSRPLSLSLSSLHTLLCGLGDTARFPLT